MKSIVFFLILCSSLQLVAQDTLASKLSGAWILTEIRLEASMLVADYPPSEDGYRWSSPQTHWLFKGRKVCEIDYPCCLLNECKLTIGKEGMIYRTSLVEGRIDEMYSVIFQNDSLILDQKLPIAGRYYFIRDTISEKELSRFTTGYVNPVCLYGDWEIPIGEVSVKFDAINVWYSWKMPEKIHINAENLHHYWANNRLYLEVDGVKRPFKVAILSDKDENMTLIPESWVNEYMKKYKLDAYQVERVWLRRIEEVVED